MVRPSGLEPPTPTMSRWCSNQLSYGRIIYWVTTGTNINEMIRFWQEEKHKFIFNCSYLKLFVDICVIPLPK